MGRHSRKNRQPREAPELRARLHQAIPSVGANVRVFATRDGTGYFVDGKGVIHKMPGRLATEAVRVNG